MKRLLSVYLLSIILILSLNACGCEHNWLPSDCINPSTCSECGKTEGNPTGHTWLAATCRDPKRCENCNVTEGEAKGHVWEEAACTVPEKCSSCNEIKGEPLGHAWEEATTEVPKTCATCQTTEGSKINTDPRFTTATAKHLFGLWTTDVVLNGDMIGMPGYFENLPCTLSYEFCNNGEVIVSVEIHDHNAFMEELRVLYTDLIYETLSAQGIGKSSADDAIQAAYGMTIAEYIELTVANIDLDDIFGSMSGDMVYYVGNACLYLSTSWYDEFSCSAYTLENDILVIEENYLEEGSEPLQWIKAE